MESLGSTRGTAGDYASKEHIHGNPQEPRKLASRMNWLLAFALGSLVLYGKKDSNINLGAVGLHRIYLCSGKDVGLRLGSLLRHGAPVYTPKLYLPDRKPLFSETPISGLACLI